jgi:DNA-binding MarR family transcriptional regulator
MEMRGDDIPVKEIAEKFGLKPIYVSSIIYKMKKDAKIKK